MVPVVVVTPPEIVAIGNEDRLAFNYGRRHTGDIGDAVDAVIAPDESTTRRGPDNRLAAPEVVNEVIARALGDHERPEKMALEPWLYRLALEAIAEMTARLEELGSSVHLEDSSRRQNVEASDEPALQFHQADEGWTRESVIADRRVSNPEEKAYSDEMFALVQCALTGVDRTDREAFLLYGIEGFSLNEIADITGRHAEAVRESVQRARDCVRSAPSLAKEFNQDLFVKARSSASKY